jgi:hypothetical protein
MGTFLDDSRYLVVALMQKKSDIGYAFAAFRLFLQQAASMRDDVAIDVEVDAASVMPCDMSANGFRIVRLHSDKAKEDERIAQDVASKDVVKNYPRRTRRSTTRLLNVSTAPSWTLRDRC